MRRPLSLLLATLCATGPVLAGDRLMIVGGGPLPEESQVSIERNVIWIDGLTQTPGYAERRLLFTAGPEKVKDVIEQRRGDAALRRYLPLSRIFGEQYDALSVFRANRLDRIDAPATAASVDRQLAETLAALRGGDSLWFIYNGHGGMESSDPSENTLRLWNDSTLDARRFATLLRARPTNTVVRAFMPQCFSGGFASALALNPESPSADHIDRLQCGFYSVPANQESEGCTVSVDAGEYRDYSTFFFAALTGRTRQGEPLAVETADGGPPTLLDAHRWAYVNGHSTDLPFTSSEYFLELWQPWYTRWQSIGTPADDNPYFPVALTIAGRLGIDADTPATLAAAAARLRRDAEQRAATTRASRDRLSTEEEALRRIVLNDFLHHYPEALFPYNARWNQRLRADESKIIDRITGHPDYPKLARLQDDLERLDRELLERERERAMVLRLQRMLRLTTIHDLFMRQADEPARQTYAALRGCESWRPPLAGDDEDGDGDRGR